MRWSLAWILALMIFSAGIVLISARRISELAGAPLRSVAQIAERVAEQERTAEDFASLEAFRTQESVSLTRSLREMEKAISQARAVAAEREAETEGRFRATFEQAASGIAHLNLQGRVVLINDVYADLIGRPANSLIGARLNDFTHAPDRPHEVLHLGPLLSGEQDQASYQIRLGQGHGPQVWVEVATALVRDRSGGPEYIVHVAHDVTERKALEDRLSHTTKMESIGRLAAGVAHDLNNMLTPVLGYAQLAREELPPTAVEGGEWMDQVVAATKRAKAVVSQLLAFGRRQVLSLETLDLNEAIGEFRDVFGTLIRANVQIDYDLAPDAPAVVADRAQLQQVFINLLTNAQDAMGGHGRITVTTRRIDDSARLAELDPNPGFGVEVVVSDEGPGVPEADLKKIFEPFYTTKEVGKGTGLGLASVYGIVDQMGGRIEATSPPGEGLTLRLVFPGVQPVTNELPSASEEILEFPSRGIVLVVEDEEAVLRLVDRAIRSFGLNTVIAADAELALTLVSEVGDLTLLISDVVLPGMNGRQLRDQLLKDHPAMESIFISGYTREVLSRDGVLESDVVLLPKPFDIDHLRREVGRALRRQENTPP